MNSLWSSPEKIEGFSFRVRTKPGVGGLYLAEAIEGDFSADTIIREPLLANCWLEFGKTPGDAMRKLKTECLSDEEPGISPKLFRNLHLCDPMPTKRES